MKIRELNSSWGKNTMDVHTQNPIDQGTVATGNKGKEKYNIKQDDPQ